MKALLDYVSTVTDSRQEKKVRHKMMDIIMLVFFASLANADDWVEMEVFGKEHEDFLRNYLELPNGIPSHDTIQRVFAMVPSEFLESFQKKWNEMLNSDEGRKVKRLLAIDGKARRGNGNKNQKANHIVSAVDERGFCLGQKRVDEKTNEITAIPELLDRLNIKGTIITTDAMGTQTAIVKKIRQKRADYVLALKGNQGTLLEDVELYFSDEEAKGEVPAIYYRVPAIGTLQLLRGKEVVMSTEAVVPQLGMLKRFPIEVITNEGLALEFHPQFGSLKSVKKK